MNTKIGNILRQPPNAAGFFILAFTLMLQAPSWAQDEGAWTQMADMPTPRGNLTAQIVGGKIYAIGGEQSHSLRLATVESYDPDTNAWETKADMPTERTAAASSVVDGKIYVFGGGIQTGIDLTTATVEAYDPATDTWETKRDMPTPRSGASTFVHDGKIYVAAGWVGGGSHALVVEIYDPATDTWENLGEAPTSAYGFYGACQVNGKFYQVGGNSPWPVYSGRSDTNVYDPTTNVWERKATMPFKKQFLSAAALNETIYAMGGSAQGAAGSEVQIYNTSINVWTEGLPLPTARSGLATISLGGKIYAIGGYSGNTIFNGEQGTVYGTVEVLTPSGFDIQDSDGDGVTDGDEVAAGSDPLDPDNFPGAWPDLIPINALGIEAEGIELGKDHDFFVGSFSYSSFFHLAFGTENPGLSPMAGAIYKGNLRTGEGAIFVPPTDKPIGGLAYDARTDQLYAATGHSDGFLSGSYREGGVVVYNATTGALITEILFGGDRIVNDLVVAEDGVYCTDSRHPELLKVLLGEGGELPSPPAFEILPMPGFGMIDVTDENGAVIDTDLNANGIVKSADGQHLIVVNVATGVLYRVDPKSGSTTPIQVAGAEALFPNGDGLYLDGSVLYICRNFPNKIAVVELSEDLTEGTFVMNLESPDLAVPTTIIGYGDSIYAINTNINDLMFGDRSRVQTQVVRLSTILPPPIGVTGVSMEGADRVRVAFSTTAAASLFDFLLESTDDPAGPWIVEEAAEVLESADGSYDFLHLRDAAEKQRFYRVGARAK